MRQIATVVGVVLLILSAVAPAAGVAAGTPGDAPANAATAQDLECSFPLSVTDTSGDDVTVDAEPERIVTLGPSAAQTMWETGGRDKVVGVSQFAGFLEGAESREVVTSGFPSTVNTEKVIDLDPDLVLAPNTLGEETVDQLRDAGVTVYRFEMADSIEAIYEKTKLIGQLSGECDGAEATVAGMQDSTETVEAAVDDENQPAVYFHMGGRYTAGPNTFIGQVVDRAGGANIAAEANATAPYPQLSAEFIVEQDPEFVVVNVPPAQLGNESRSYIPTDSVVRNTTAWTEGNIVVVNSNNISQPAPRIVDPLTQMAQAFHPDAYADANTTTTTTETAAATTEAKTTGATSEETTTAAQTTTEPDDTGTTIPGFGIGTALVAVLGAVLFARR